MVVQAAFLVYSSRSFPKKGSSSGQRFFHYWGPEKAHPLQKLLVEPSERANSQFQSTSRIVELKATSSRSLGLINGSPSPCELMRWTLLQNCKPGIFKAYVLRGRRGRLGSRSASWCKDRQGDTSRCLDEDDHLPLIFSPTFPFPLSNTWLRRY